MGCATQRLEEAKAPFINICYVFLWEAAGRHPDYQASGLPGATEVSTCYRDVPLFFTGACIRLPESLYCIGLI